MFTIPIEEATLPFAAPLGASGLLRLRVTDDVLRLLKNNLPFSPTVAHGPDQLLLVEFDLGAAPTLRLGPLDGVALEVTGGTQAALDLVWPDEDPALLAAYGLPVRPDEVYLALTCAGQASIDASVTRSLPPYALSATLGLKTGAQASLTYLKPFKQQEGAADVVRRLFEGVRLPFAVASADDLPGPGEVLVFQYGGYLDVRMQAAWGYALNRYEEKGLGQLNLKQRIEMTSALELGVGFKIAGDFSLEVRQGTQKSWGRVVVRKRRRSEMSAALDLSVDVRLTNEGLPEDAAQFLDALLDLDLPPQVEALRPLLDLPPAELDAWLREKADGLTEHFVCTLFSEWFPDATIEAKAGPFLKQLRKALDAYDRVHTLDERLTALLTTHAAEQLEAARARLAMLADRAAVTSLRDALLWNILRQLLGDRYFDFLTDDEAFARLKADALAKLEALLDARSKELRDLAGLSRALLKLDALAAELRQYDTPEKLKAQAQRHLLTLSQRLTGKALDGLKGSKLQEAFAELQDVLNHLDELKTRLYDRFREALNGTYKLALSQRYTAARETDALVDVEINLDEAEGRRYLRQALLGDFSSLLTPVAAAFVQVHEGKFTHLTRRTRELSISLLGWQYERFHELALHADELVRPQGDGLLHVYDLRMSELDRRRGRGEEVQLSFLLGLLAEGFQAPETRPDLIDAVSQMTADYAFHIRDAETSDRELADYLTLARHLGLLPAGVSVANFMEDLRSQLGLAPLDPWGTVAVTYQVRYDPAVLLSIFRFLKAPSIKAIARNTFREIAAANFARFGNANTTALARALPCEGTFRAWAQSKLRLSSNAPESFTFPCGDGPGVTVTLDRLRRLVLDALYQTEEAFLEAFVALDDAIDRSGQGGDKPDREQLEKAFETFAKQRRALERFMTLSERDRFVNPFFAILDALIAPIHQARLIDDQGRRSTMELTITAGDKTLSKMLVA